MDDAFYLDLAQGASELIEQLGQPCVLSREGGTSVYDVNTGTTTDVANDTFTASAVKLDYETRDIDGTTILSGDVRFIIGFELNIEPRAGDAFTLTRHNEKYRVVRSKPLDPGGVAVIYDVQARDL